MLKLMLAVHRVSNQGSEKFKGLKSERAVWLGPTEVLIKFIQQLLLNGIRDVIVEVCRPNQSEHRHLTCPLARIKFEQGSTQELHLA